MARHLSIRGVSSEVVAPAAAALAAGQPIEPGARQQTAALVRLADLGAVYWPADGEVRWTGTMSVVQALAASDAQTQREDEVERTRLAMMRRYAEHPGCRRSFLLTYFGQDYPGPCGNCDNDLGHPGAPPAGVPFAVGTHVVSERWGQARSSATTATRSRCCSTSTATARSSYRSSSERDLLRPA